MYLHSCYVFIHTINMAGFHNIFLSISQAYITETPNKKKRANMPCQVSELITVSWDFSLQVPFKGMKRNSCGLGSDFSCSFIKHWNLKVIPDLY